ncbi:activator of HSP90 ATPase [Dictyobacter alpinus]|uniref:Activator of HSP90 ATPase n=1 Tax=Dictyobacter alpinus TaxID=2014873 RepID=A0A402BB40_9CHLR|nr:SRPBCC domain-containing protein [Dictyobacter alpinus]GCE28565.1 activator of HSP90 ATPase [Dictyobacter alpinus]
MFDYQSLSTRIGEQDFVVERQFNVPRALMFQVFTQPEHLKRWWAPAPYTIPVCTIDLRPGGIWHYCMRSPEGDDHWSRSVYNEIVRPEKLVYSSTFADEHANPIEGVPEHLATVTFTEEGGTTHVSARFQFTTTAALKVAINMGMMQGMSTTWDYLAVYVQELQAE